MFPSQVTELVHARMENLEPVLKQVEPFFVDDCKGFFHDESSADAMGGNEWAELSETTQESYATRGNAESDKRGANHKLQKTGAMFRSVKGRVTKNSIEVGTNEMKKGYPVPKVHQLGTKPGTTPIIPRRTFLAFKKETVQRAADALGGYVSLRHKAGGDGIITSGMSTFGS